MTTTIEPRQVDQERLDAFVGQLVTDVGATLSAGLVVIGDRLGLYRAMADGTPVTAEELAERTDTSVTYLRPWLANQAAGGYVEQRSRDADLVDDAGTGVRAGRRGQPGVLRRQHAARARRAARRPGHRGAVPLRDGLRLARARPGPLRGNRAVLPAGLRREPGRLVAAGPRRRRPEAGARRSRRRRRLRPRRVHDPDGAGVPGLDASSGSTTTRRRSPSRVAGPPRQASPTGSRSRSPTPPNCRPAVPTWWRCSTACTTWATPRPPPASAPRSAQARRHADGRRADGRRPGRGQPPRRRAALLRRVHPRLHAAAAGPAGAAGARHPGRSGHPHRGAPRGRLRPGPGRHLHPRQPRARSSPEGDPS